MKQKLIYSLPLWALASISVLNSCQDLDWGYTADEIKYKTSFEKLYGEIPADKSWDFSAYTNLYDPEKYVGNTRGGAGGADFSRVVEEGTHYAVKSWWEVPSQTVRWMDAALKEGKDNRYLGSNFVLQFPENDFVIIPIFQGNSSINSELEVKVNGYSIKSVWKKNSNLLVNDHFLTDAELNGLPAVKTLPAEYNSSDPNCPIAKYTNQAKDKKWHMLGFYNGWEYAADPDDADHKPTRLVSQGKTLDEIKAMDKEYACEMYQSSTLKAKRIVSKPIYFRQNQFEFAEGDKRFMYLSLHNTGTSWASWTDYEKRWDQESNTWTTIGHRLTSINPEGHMLALNVPSSYRPKQDELPQVQENGKKPNQVIMVACEDANGSSTDHDVNDVVFLIIGYPNAPTIVPTKEVVEKRYMCEDLGGTYDFDFNDIVVDVARTRYFKIDAEPNTIDDPFVENIHIKDMVVDIEKPEVQMATISHVCGTLPIQARVGNYFFPKISDPTDKYKTRSELEAAGTLLTSDDEDLTRAQHTNFTTVELPSGWNPNKTRIITDNSWDPDQNNIRIYVEWPDDKNPGSNWGVDGADDKHQSLSYNPTDPSDYFADFSGKNFKVVKFPNKYSDDEATADQVRVPYIIATDPTVPWMNESKCVPPAWIEGDFSAELAPLTPGAIDYSDHPAGPGSCFFMEQYPAGAGEGRIWEGDVTGMAATTGIAFKPGTPEMEALMEGYGGGRNYKLLNIYTDPMSGQTGRVGIMTMDADGEWIPLNNNYADGYLQYSSREEGRFMDTSLGCNDFECTTIYLKDADWNTIQNNGLVVVSYTDALHIRKITTSRPVILKSGSESDKGIYSNNKNLLTDANNTVICDGGYTINITVPENGSIKGTERERIADIQTPEEGASAEKIAQIESHNAAELERVRVPFLTAHYTRYATVGLTAVAKPGYAFDYWTVNGSKDASRTTSETTVACPYDKTLQAAQGTPSSITVSAVFKTANNPGISLLPRHNNDKARLDTTLTIAKGSDFVLGISSDNKEIPVDIFGGNTEVATTTTTVGQYAHSITIHGNEVGTSSFLVYQRDHGSWGVSEEISVKVNVVERPANTVQLTPSLFHKWDRSCTPDAIIQGVGSITNNIGTKITNATDNNYCQVVLGSSSNSYQEYADLTRSDYLIINMDHFDGEDIELARNQKLTAPRLFFNWESGGSKVEIAADDSKYSTVINNSDPTNGDRFQHFGTVTYIINLKEVRNRHGYFSTLNNIQTNYGKSPQCTKIKSVYLDKYECPGETKYSVNATCSPAEVGLVTVSVQDGKGILMDASGNKLANSVTDGNTVYVYKGTTVHLAAPNNANYTFNQWSNGAKTLERDLTVTTNSAPTAQYTAGANIDADIASATVDFSTTMYHRWNGSSISQLWPEGAIYKLGISQDVILGQSTGTVPETDYADLSNSTLLVVTVSGDGTPRFLFNKVGESTTIIECSNNTVPEAYKNCVFCKTNSDGTHTYSIHLASLKDSNGSVRLNGIKRYGSCSFTSIKLDQYSCASEKNFIKNETTSVKWTTVALDNADGLYKHWTATDANGTSSAYSGATTNNDKSLYGDNGVNGHNYADISNYSILKLAVNQEQSQRAPRFLFNREGDSGTYLEIKSNVNKEFITVSTDFGGWKMYYVNLSAIKAKYGYVHLNAVKTDYEGGGSDEIVINEIKIR